MGSKGESKSKSKSKSKSTSLRTKRNKGTRKNKNNPAKELKAEILSHITSEKAKKTMDDMFLIKGKKLIGASSGFDYTGVPKKQAYEKAAFMLTLIFEKKSAKKLKKIAKKL